ncbi:MAG TPA: twin-arginine translocation signal domain-containing protein [Actinomycetota bacterium]|nr:twin-arginine translocation signal domain-containing protein [Actinomycetota bacterium]
MDRTIDRRSFLKQGAAVGTAALGLSVYGLGDLEALAGRRGCRFGALVLTDDQLTGLKQMEKRLGRRFATTHHRLPWTNDLDNSFTRWSVQTNHRPIVSWFARTKAGPVSWSRIATGGYDGWITSQARSLKRLGGRGYLCFHKEPEDEGTPGDWKAAYRRVRTIFDNTGVSGYKYLVVLTAATFNKGDAAMWLPDRYDGLGVDGYNRHRCFGVDWRSFRKIFAPSRSFAKARGKKLYVIEAGCVERNPGEKAKWLRGARQTIKAWPEIRAFSYNHEVTDCNYLLTSSPSSFRAFRAMGKDPYFRKR